MATKTVVKATTPVPPIGHSSANLSKSSGVSPAQGVSHAAPTYQTDVPFSDTGYSSPSSGTYSSNSYGTGLMPMVAPPTDEDYLAGDSGFQTQNSALKAALQRFMADSDFQRNNYNTDYNRSLHDLGYDEGTKQWNWLDKLTASGNAYQNQLDDFGGRGMLNSSAYADAQTNLTRQFNQQYDAMAGNKQTFMSDLDNQLANYQAENTSSIQAARAEALQRRAAQYSLT